MPDIKTEHLALTGLIGLLIIGGSLVAVNPASIIGESKASFSTWYGAPDIPDFKEMNGYTSTIGELEIDNSQFGGFSNQGYPVGCFVNPKVTLSGQVIDDFELNGDRPQATTYQAPNEYTWDVDESRPDKTYQLSDGTKVKVGYLTAFNFDATTFRGNYYGGSCKGIFNDIEVEFPEEKVSHSVEASDTVRQGSNAEVSINVDNQFSNALSYEGQMQVCKPGFEECETREVSSQLSEGANTITTRVNADQSGEYRITATGQITLDTGAYPIENVHYDSNDDGTYQVLTGSRSINFADTEGTVTFTAVADSDNDGVYDNDDKCPETGGQGLGVKENGCPVQDSDNDGVVDSKDDEPDTYGSNRDGTPTFVDSIINFLGIRGFL